MRISGIRNAYKTRKRGVIIEIEEVGLMYNVLCTDVSCEDDLNTVLLLLLVCVCVCVCVCIY